MEPLISRRGFHRLAFSAAATGTLPQHVTTLGLSNGQVRDSSARHHPLETGGR